MRRKASTYGVGRGVLIASWALAAAATSLPTYAGEFLTPGGERFVIGIMWILGPVLFLLAGLSEGYGGFMALVMCSALSYPPGFLC